MPRPSVDVIIPFAGTDAAFENLLARLRAMSMPMDDRLIVVDNRAQGRLIEGDSAVAILPARTKRSSYHARNVGARVGDRPWMLFLDADVDWEPSLLDAYFEPPPDDRTAVLAGGIEDAPAGPSPTLAERYAASMATMSDLNTVRGDSPYAQTANCMVRRAAFEAIGGFDDDVRSGGDADLSVRLRAAGWAVERRAGARVTHRNRRALRALLAQKARHGSGAAWVERRHPGTFPRRRLPGLALWSVRSLLRPGETQATRAIAAVDVLAVWAFELGRLAPNRVRAATGRAGG